MQIEVRTWGESAGLRISKQLLRELNVEIGEMLDVEVINGGLILHAAKPQEYVLEDLLETCTPSRLGYFEGR